MQDYWKKQQLDEPLFPDLIWSRPQNRQSSGKLLIVGGNVQGFSAAGESYSQATKACIGSTRVLLPDSLSKTVGSIFEGGEFAPSTPSGSFSRQALGEVLNLAAWADGVLIAGDLGRNSETAVLLEETVSKYEGQLTLTKDAVDYFTTAPSSLLTRPNTLIVLGFAQLQKLASSARYTKAFTFDMDILRLIEQLHDFTEIHKIAIVTKHLDNIFVGYDGSVSSTKLNIEIDPWRVNSASSAAVWWLQNPNKTFESITTSIVDSLTDKTS
jgi:hypothetical protein